MVKGERRLVNRNEKSKFQHLSARECSSTKVRVWIFSMVSIVIKCKLHIGIFTELQTHVLGPLFIRRSLKRRLFTKIAEHIAGGVFAKPYLRDAPVVVEAKQQHHLARAVLGKL